MEELVSIVVPVYNVEEYLDECVRSLVDQTYRNLEIILVDDGSTDRSGEMCDRWAQVDSRITVIHKDNEGLGFTRNRGMDAACGKYIFFIDSDDYIAPSTVEKCVQSALENHADAVLFGRSNVFMDGRTVPEKINPPRLCFSGDSIFMELLPGMFTYEYGFGITVAGRMHNLEFMRKTGIRFYSEREIISEDAYYSLTLFASMHRVSIVPEPLYHYRKRQNSLSHSYRPDRHEKNNIFMAKCLRLCDEVGYPVKVSLAVRARYLMYMIADMKHIIAAEISVGEKRKALRDIFEDPVLHGTLTDDVLALINRSSQIFWKLFAKNHFYLCWGLLWYKVHR